MTRFARADGSKGSNKRECEEATPWEVMKRDILIQKKKKKKVKNAEEEKKIILSSSDDIKIKKSPIKTDDTNSDNVINTEQKNNEKKKKKGVSLEEKKKNWVIEDGKKYKVFKNGIKKPWFDLAYEENDVMTRYNNFFILRKDVDQLDQFKKSLQEKNLSDKEITNKILYKERKLHNKLRLELLRNEIEENKNATKTETNGKTIKIGNKKPIMNLKNKKKTKFSQKFEENEIMTNFEGYWILRENLQHLQKVADIKFWRIINDRTDGNEDKNLTSDEELAYRRLMKKEKRRESNLLKEYLKEKNGVKNTSHAGYQNEGVVRKPWQNNYDDSTVKFDGYYVNKEGAERLSKLKETMMAKGCTEEEIAEVLKTERRKEERSLKRSNKSFCYQCRKPGHMVSHCPENAKPGTSNNYTICFKCGSAEHTAKFCKSRSQSSSSYPLATCFICKEVGHISRECPDNPKGLYPNGGCCISCGSVEHLKRDCPEYQQKKAKETITVSVFRRGDQVEDIEDEFKSPSDPQSSWQKQKPKIIQFA